MADLGEGPPYFGKKEEIAEGRKAGRASKAPPPPLLKRLGLCCAQIWPNDHDTLAILGQRLAIA